MIDILLGVAVLFAITAGGVAAYQFAATGERPLLPLAGVAGAFAAVFSLGRAAGYFWAQAATVLTGLSILLALGLTVQWYRER